MKVEKDESIKFSILIPVYNVEEYLHECLNSVLNQTYSNFEVVITNDGSTDSSAKICMNYASNDERISVYHQENKGLLLARRNSIAHSTGDYYLFLDSDDTWESNTLETVYSTIKKTEADMIIYNWNRLKGDVIIPSKPLFKKEGNNLDVTKDKAIEKFISTNKLNSLCLKAVKRDIVDDEKDYSHLKGLIIGEDALQSMPLFLNAENIVYIPDALYNYRINAESSSNSFKSNNLQDINVVYRTKIKFLHKINRIDLFQSLGIRYVNTLSKQIMLAGISSMQKIEKVNYLKAIRISNIYTEMKKYYQLADLLLPIRIMINELNEERYENVLKLSKLYSVFWDNLEGLRERVKYKTRN